MKFLRTLLIISVAWGLLWAALAIGAGTLITIIDPSQIDPGEEPFVLAPSIGLAGLLCGVLFSTFLSAGERGRTMTNASIPRVVMCGILASASIAVLAGKGLPELVVIVPVGIGSALASIAIIRRLRGLSLPY